MKREPRSYKLAFIDLDDRRYECDASVEDLRIYWIRQILGTSLTAGLLRRRLTQKQHDKVVPVLEAALKEYVATQVVSFKPRARRAR